MWNVLLLSTGYLYVVKYNGHMFIQLHCSYASYLHAFYKGGEAGCISTSSGLRTLRVES